jgi:hypothetical protein
MPALLEHLGETDAHIAVPHERAAHSEAHTGIALPVRRGGLATLGERNRHEQEDLAVAQRHVAVLVAARWVVRRWSLAAPWGPP